jgi:hypothetical protein
MAVRELGAAVDRQDQDRFLFHGLHLLAMDGSTLRLGDSAANQPDHLRARTAGKRAG